LAISAIFIKVKLDNMVPFRVSETTAGCSRMEFQIIKVSFLKKVPAIALNRIVIAFKGIAVEIVKNSFS
jgi:hypothetical protein